MIAFGAGHSGGRADFGGTRDRHDPGRPAGAKIDRHIFGQFAEHLGRELRGVWVGGIPIFPTCAASAATWSPRWRDPRAQRALARRLLARGIPLARRHWRSGPSAGISVTGNWAARPKQRLGTHEFFDFAEQIGAEAYVSVNVGSARSRKAADWIAYITADDRNTAGQERAANGRREPWKLKFLGIGNESWGCGGNMRPQYYADELKRYARFVRSFHPDQQAAPNLMQRIAVGPSDGDTAYTEGVMEAWSTKDWSWNMEGLRSTDTRGPLAARLMKA